MRHYITNPARLVLAGIIAASLSAGGRVAQATNTVGAPPSPPARLLEEAYHRKATGDLSGAVFSFRQAQAAGADAQRVALELGYLENARGSLGDAHSHFAAAAEGPDGMVAAQARRELAVLPRRLTADLYGDAFGWRRTAGANAFTDVVPTVRVRAFFRPSFALDLHVYGYMQATRDAASRGRDAAGVPGGVRRRLRPHRRRPDVAPVRSARSVCSPRAAPPTTCSTTAAPAAPSTCAAACSSVSRAPAAAPTRPDRPSAWTCAATSTGRASTSAASSTTSSVSPARTWAPATWSPAPSPGRRCFRCAGSGDRNADYYNNFADGGVAHRWRLMGALPFDLSAGVSAGRYFGRQGLDPLPGELRYLDLRLVAATQLEF
jgi:hypothetical protein